MAIIFKGFILMKLTPMMQQYYEIKKQHPDKYIFFRVGDFYELFDQDALEAAPILQITLTKINGASLCGIPHHQLNNYAYKLLQMDKKIAIVEQVDDPVKDGNQGIIKREVVQVLTPGTVIDNNNLKTGDNNFILSLFYLDSKDQVNQQLELIERSSVVNTVAPQILLGALDISTGENEIIFIKNSDNFIEEIKTYLAHYEPKEIIINRSQKEFFVQNNATSSGTSLLGDYAKTIINTLPEKIYTPQYYRDIALTEIKDCYKLSSLKKINMEDYSYQGVMLYTLIYYIKENFRSVIRHLKFPKVIKQNNYLILDKITQKNLELVKNNHDGSENYTLFKTINATQTSMGRRLLKRWLLRPLLEVSDIVQRQNNIQFFYNQPVVLNELRHLLKKICDIERYCARISMNSISPKEINYLKDSLQQVRYLINLLEEKNYQYFNFQQSNDISKLITAIEKTILAEPASNLSQGEVIVTNFNSELEKYNLLKKNSKDLINNLEQEEKKRLNNPRVKIKYTNAQGYFIEIKKNNKVTLKFPDRYIKRQSLVNADRFVTEELLMYQDEINSAVEKAIAIENDIFNSFKEYLISKIVLLQDLAEQIAQLDVFCSFAHLSLTKNYTKPEISTDDLIEINGGRHPIVENEIEENFIVNSIQIGGDENQLHLITGPNMSGKSTFLRQTALLIILAQMGAWLPCRDAKIGICDRIFTRIGANDNISKGESTFLVEMSETASILYHCTDQSFIVMDEIGRGTSTYDGLALAWSIIEYLVTTKTKQARTLFATHYHELVHLADNFSAIKNFNVSVKEEKDNIFFLKKIVPGVANRSYGVHVAKLAGVPKEIIAHSQKLLSILEKKDSDIKINMVATKEEKLESSPAEVQESTNSFKEADLLAWVREKISSFDVNQDRPLDAVNVLDEIQTKLKQEN